MLTRRIVPQERRWKSLNPSLLRAAPALAGVFAIALGGLGRAEPAQAETADSPLHFHGYIDVHYNNPELETMDQGAVSEADVHRAALGWSYEFTPNIRLDAEVDYEHGADEIEVEYAHIEDDLTSSLTLRAGSVLLPVGPLNEAHEPTLYYSVERPYVETTIVPTTWQEIGLGLIGRTGSGGLAYRGYLVTGLDATRIGSIRGMDDVQTHGSHNKAEDLAGVARVEYAWTSGLSFGASGYYGGADQSEPGLGQVNVGIANADARYRAHGLDLRGVYYRVMVDGADSVSAFVGETIGKAMMGWYGEAAYDVLGKDLAAGRRSLVVFGRYEAFDTNLETPAGLAAEPGAFRSVITGGIAYYPIEKVAFKADFEHWKDDTDAELNRLNLGAAVRF